MTQLSKQKYNIIVESGRRLYVNKSLAIRLFVILLFGFWFSCFFYHPFHSFEYHGQVMKLQILESYWFLGFKSSFLYNGWNPLSFFRRCWRDSKYSLWIVYFRLVVDYRSNSSSCFLHIVSFFSRVQIWFLMEASYFC